MKNLLLLSLTAFLLSACEGEISSSELVINEDFVKFSAASSLTKKELLTFKKRLKEEKNIDMDISECTFEKDGRVEFFCISVNCNDGYEGSASGVLAFGKAGFVRNYKGENVIPFAIGKMTD